VRPCEVHIPNVRIRSDRVAGFDLEGTADALRQLADAVVRGATVEVFTDGGERGSVTAVAGTGPLVMTRAGPHVRLCGNMSSLELLAEALRSVARGRGQPSPVQLHAHVEYFPGHEWISEASDPLVIYLDERVSG
jgi:hypothetical protein